MRDMREERHKFALRLKVIEILSRYSKVQQQFHIMRQWKNRWICSN